MWADDTYIYFYLGNIDIGYGYNYYVIYASPSAITHTSNRGELVIPWGYGYWVQGSESTVEYPYSRSFGVPLPASAWFGGGVKPSSESIYRFRTGSIYPSRTDLTRNLVSEATVSLKTVFEQICTDAQIPAGERQRGGARLAMRSWATPPPARRRPAASWSRCCRRTRSTWARSTTSWSRSSAAAASVATITTGELGVVEGAGVTPGTRLLEARPDPQELPTHLTVNYESKARDYDNASQNAARVDKPLFVPMTMALPMVMTDEAAKRQGEVALNALWASRCKYRFTLGPKYLYLSPTDVITVGGKSMRITAIHYRGLMMEVTAESEDGGNYRARPWPIRSSSPRRISTSTTICRRCCSCSSRPSSAGYQGVRRDLRGALRPAGAIPGRHGAQERGRRGHLGRCRHIRLHHHGQGGRLRGRARQRGSRHPRLHALALGRLLGRGVRARLGHRRPAVGRRQPRGGRRRGRLGDHPV